MSFPNTTLIKDLTDSGASENEFSAVLDDRSIDSLASHALLALICTQYLFLQEFQGIVEEFAS